MSLSKRRVAKNAFSQFAAFGFSGASKALVAIVVARWLGPHGFGAFTLAWTIASMASFFAPLGLDYRLIRELNRDRGPRDVSTSLLIASISASTIAAALATGPHLVGAGHDIAWAITAASAFVVLSAPVLVFRAVFHSRERMELETLTLVVEGAVSLGAVALLLGTGGGIVAAVAGLAVGRAANLAVSFVLYRRLCGRLQPVLPVAEWPSILRTSIPMGFAYIFHTVMLRFDVVMLAFFRSPEDVGIYTAATMIVMTVPIISTAFNTSLYPVLSRSQGVDDPELKRVFGATWRMLVVVGIAAAAGLSVLARPVIDLFYGSEFRASVIVLIALSWILPLRFINNLSGVTLNATDLAGRRMMAIGAAAFVNLALNLAFIPVWGYQGAVVSTLVTEICLTIVFRRLLAPVSPPALRPILEGLGVGAVVAVIVSFTPGHVLARAGLGTVLFAAIVAASLWAPRISVPFLTRQGAEA